ncbi:MgPa adhesin [Mycoplasmoides genitalium M2321]|nr:MgPa adhesin [Mycoplasmoides genitalium M2321]
MFDGTMERGMWLASFLYFQPNKVKSGQYQTTNTYNKLIEPDNATSAATNMTNLLKLLSSKNIKQKLGKGAVSSQGSKTPFPSLFLIQIVIVIKLHQEPLKRLILWKVIKNHQ